MLAFIFNARNDYLHMFLCKSHIGTDVKSHIDRNDPNYNSGKAISRLQYFLYARSRSPALLRDCVCGIKRDVSLGPSDLNEIDPMAAKN